MPQVYTNQCSASHDEGGSSVDLRTDALWKQKGFGPAKNVWFRLVDEGLGKAGDYPFRDVGGRGPSWR